MKCNIFSLLVGVMLSLTMQAQYVVSDKYDLWFEDTGHEVTTRKPEYCTENHQDLHNGCQVRISGYITYIYKNSYSILYGDEINLLYNGYYRVRRGNTWYLADEDGNSVDGIYGSHIYYYPFGYITVQRSSGYWDVYHCSGTKVNFYSQEAPYIFWNGCWLIKQGNYWYACEQDGDKINEVYGDQISLLNDGRWKCVRGDYVTYVE